MLYTIKTLQQKVFQIDIDEQATVKDLKIQIMEKQGHAVELQKLIHSGKILPDSKILKDCSIKEKDFIVLMVNKPKVTKATAPESSAEPSEPTPSAAASTPTPSAAASTPTPPAAASTPTAAAASSTSAQSSGVVSSSTLAVSEPSGDGLHTDMGVFLTGEALQDMINKLVEMGFERDQVIRALRASFNNPDRAVEYLMSDTPLDEEQPAASSDASAGAAAASSAPSPQGLPASQQPQAQTTADAPQNLFQLAQQQQHQQPALSGLTTADAPQNLFQLAQQQQQQQQPALTGLPRGAPGSSGIGEQLGALQDLSGRSPDEIQHHILQSLVRHPEITELLQNDRGFLDRDFLGQLLAGEATTPQLPDDTTEDDRNAIERLQALGFSRDAVIEAYFVCDRDESLAANYLFDMGDS